jgi:hypothetical protein
VEDRSYRDELAAALARNAQLEAEVAALRAPRSEELIAQLAALRATRETTRLRAEQEARVARKTSGAFFLAFAAGAAFCLLMHAIVVAAVFAATALIAGVALRLEGNRRGPLARLDQQILALERQQSAPPAPRVRVDIEAGMRAAELLADAEPRGKAELV